MKNKKSLRNPSDPRHKIKIDETISTEFSTKDSSNSKDETLTTIGDHIEPIQKKVRVDLIEIPSDDVTIPMSVIENSKEKSEVIDYYRYLLTQEEKESDLVKNDKDVVSLYNPLTNVRDPLKTTVATDREIKEAQDNLDNLSSTNSRAREDSITIEVKAAINSPTNTQNEITKFFSIEKNGDKNNEPMLESEINMDNTLTLAPESLDINSDIKQILARGIQYKHRANSLFKKNKFKESLIEYLKAVEEINTLLSHRSKAGINMTNINWLRLECLNNIAVCYLLLKEYNKVLFYTEQVLQINSNNVNSLSYRAKAFISLKLYKEAIECIKKALSIKYSKRLMTMLKEIEGKIDESDINCEEFLFISQRKNDYGEEKREITEKIKLNHSDGKISDIDTNSKRNVNSISDNSENSSLKPSSKEKKNSFIFSLLLSFLKFSKILSIGVIDFLRRYKYGILILIVIWMITFRTSFKNRLLNILKIKFV